jgi:metal-sulfur cluster biosynthetic enzyme
MNPRNLSRISRETGFRPGLSAPVVLSTGRPGRLALPDRTFSDMRCRLPKFRDATRTCGPRGRILELIPTPALGFPKDLLYPEHVTDIAETAEHPEATADAPSAPATSGAPAAPLFDAERRATELAILDALRAVVDPEIGMNVVELALIKQILLGQNETEIKMILTTPFCPYAGSMIAQVQEQAESVVEHPVKVTLLAERWDPRDAGLMW